MITLLTPTYNRAHLLKTVYDSLLNQSCKDFEWIVVDDGSSDNTEQLVRGWASDCKDFVIKYYKQKNGGKHRAVNVGVQYASYDYILILDSDDFLTDTAVGKIHSWIESIKDLPGFAGVSGLKGYDNETAVGKKTDFTYVDATNAERVKYKLNADMAEVYKTEIMKKYPFPEFDGENFLRENASWDKIAKDGYKLRWFNEVIYICEYLEGGLTKTVDAEVYIKNFQGFTYCSKLYCECRGFPYKQNRIGYYFRVAKLMNKPSEEICNALNISRFSLYSGRLIYRLNSLKNKIKAIVR